MEMAGVAAPLRAHTMAPRPAYGAMREHWLTSAEAALALGISERMARKLARRGALHAERWGYRWIITRDSVLARQRETGRGGTA